jgi:hypothetical protein
MAKNKIMAKNIMLRRGGWIDNIDKYRDFLKGIFECDEFGNFSRINDQLVFKNKDEGQEELKALVIRILNTTSAKYRSATVLREDIIGDLASSAGIKKDDISNFLSIDEVSARVTEARACNETALFIFDKDGPCCK